MQCAMCNSNTWNVFIQRITKYLEFPASRILAFNLCCKSNTDNVSCVFSTTENRILTKTHKNQNNWLFLFCNSKAWKFRKLSCGFGKQTKNQMHIIHHQLNGICIYFKLVHVSYALAKHNALAQCAYYVTNTCVCWSSNWPIKSLFIYLLPKIDTHTRVILANY